MKPLRKDNDFDAGSRMHVLERLKSPKFLPVLRGWLRPIGFTVEEHAAYQPKGRHDHRKSVLVGRNEPFLSVECGATIKVRIRQSG